MTGSKMVQKTLDELLNSAKNKAICAFTVKRDIRDTIALNLSDNLNIEFEYDYHALKGIYYISKDSSIFYTPGNSLRSHDAVQTLKDYVQNQFGRKENREMRILTDSNINNIVRIKFFEHGLKNLALETIPVGKINYDILSVETETSAFVMGLQNEGKRKICYSIGRGREKQKGEI